MHTILHVGAGQSKELPQLLDSGAEKIILVEPNPVLAEQLRLKTAEITQVTVVEAAITNSPANDQLHEYNLSEASSMYPATGLKTLFPGLKLSATHTVATVRPEQLLAEHGPQSGQLALLHIQVPGGEHALLQTLINTDQLKHFSDLRVNANPKPYYLGSVAAKETLEALVDYGYEITDENLQDPDWPSWHLTRNPLKDQISFLQAQNEQLTVTVKQLEEELKRNQQQFEKKLSVGSCQKGKLEEGNNQSKLLKVSAQKSDEKIIQAMQSKLDKQIETLGSKLENHLDEKLTSAAKQVESSLSLQYYFNTGELPLSHFGKPISPDLAMFLTEKIESENYDLVIEFGSGNSTVLLAKVLKKKQLLQKQQAGLENNSISSSNSKPAGKKLIDGVALPNAPDLNKKLITFEQSKLDYQKTVTMLRQTGLEQVVSLVHAPLVDNSYKGEDYLYCDCDLTLKKIAKLYESKALKILVLINGPSGETELYARFPALLKLLNYLGTATFELILDNPKNLELQVITKRWIALTQERAVSYNEKKIPHIKSAVCISIGEC